MPATNQNLRILLLAPGISIHSQRFLQMLLDAGHTVTFVDSHAPKLERTGRCKFVPLPSTRLERSRLRGTSRLSSWIKLAKLRLIWQNAQPDLVHVHWVDYRAFQCAQARLHPLVLTCWGSDINNLFDPDHQDREYRQRIARALAVADHITADSPEVVERCEILAGSKLNTSLFYFGIDTNLFRPGYTEQAQALREQLGIPLCARVMLSPRALRPLLGHHHVLEAFACIANQPQFDDVVLVFKRFLLLADGYEERLKARTCELGLDRRVYWMDEIPYEQMPAEYAIADIVVNYPERDGFPVTLLEAVACKRVVISSDLPAYRGAFENLSVTVPPCNVDALADAMRSCLTEESFLRRERVEKVFRIVSEKGTREKQMQVIENVYETLVCNKRRTALITKLMRPNRRGV